MQITNNYLTKNFLKSNHAIAANLILRHEDFSELAADEIKKGNFDKAEQFLQHATNLVHELKNLKMHKQLFEESKEILSHASQTQLDNIMIIRKDWL